MIELLSAISASCFCLAFTPIIPTVFVVTLVVATISAIPVGFWLLVDSMGDSEYRDSFAEPAG